MISTDQKVSNSIFHHNLPVSHHLEGFHFDARLHPHYTASRNSQRVEKKFRAPRELLF
jgi:hypothetical protein